MPSNDEIAIIKLKGKIKDRLERVVETENEQIRIIGSLADKMRRTAKEKRELLRLYEELEKLLNKALTNPVSNIDKNELNVLKRAKSVLSQSMENQLLLADSFADLASVYKDFLKKKAEYIKLYKKLVDLENKWQSEAYNYMKLENKFEDERKILKVADKLAELESEMKRTQSQTDRKIKSLLEDAEALDRAWSGVKSSIKKYGW